MAGILHAMMPSTITTPSFDRLVYAKDTFDVNIHNDLIAAGWDGVTPVTAEITVENSVKIMASSTAIYAMDTGTFPAGSVLTLVNKGYIIGRGGNGGNTFNGDNSTPGTNGGPAFRAQYAIAITNQGVIGGGGGGGGGGGSGEVADPPGVHTISGGAGGGGASLGKGGTTINGYNGVSANELQPGAGGPSAGGQAGRGGNGGSLGNPGEPGQNGYQFHFPRVTTGQPGGAPGLAITGAPLITWTFYGNVYGPLDVGAPPTFPKVQIEITSNTQDFNLISFVQSLGRSPTTEALAVDVVIAAGVTISASSTAVPAFQTGSGWFAGTLITLVNNGNIIGRGGNGGNGGIGNTGQFNGTPGGNGGPAFQAQFAIKVTNNGIIGGGGGGGGGGAGSRPNFNIESGGSGGGGAGNGLPGSVPAGAALPGHVGQAGSQLAAGNGGSGWRSPFGNGGPGGQLGNPGTAGNYNNQGLAIGGSPGAAGPAVIGNSFITWVLSGDRRGPLT